MKKLLLLLLLSNVAYAQDSLYTKEQLTATGKLSLTTIYLNQCNQLVTLLPKVVFNDYNFKNDIPVNKFVTKRRENVNDATVKFNAYYSENYRDITPYADKKELVDGILYLQGIIEKLKGGVK
jgi:hypothetical protein